MKVDRSMKREREARDHAGWQEKVERTRETRRMRHARQDSADDDDDDDEMMMRLSDVTNKYNK